MDVFNLRNALIEDYEKYVKSFIAAPSVMQGSNRIVLASRVSVLIEPQEPSAPDRSAGGTHASPAAHDRRGHWRTLGRGTARERMVWVRTTTVGEHQTF